MVSLYTSRSFGFANRLGSTAFGELVIKRVGNRHENVIITLVAVVDHEIAVLKQKGS